MFNKDKNNQLLDEHLTTIPSEKRTSDVYFWIRMVMFFVITFVMGGISAWVRPFFTGAHIEAIVSLLLLIGINIGLLIYFIKREYSYYKIAYVLTTGSVWMGYCIGWTVVWGSYWDDVFLIHGMAGLIGIGGGLLAFWRIKQ